MSLSPWLSLASTVLWLAVSLQAWQAKAEPALSQPDRLAQATACPTPVLSRLVRHRIVAGETLDSIAQHYDLIPATLMGFNPVLRDGKTPVGAEIVIPPYNGIRVEVPAGKTWRDVAATYKVRADVLFEANGCQMTPKLVFVPGVNWSPIAALGSTRSQTPRGIVARYPLPTQALVLLSYGWQQTPTTGVVAFHSGVDLAAVTGTSVLAAGDGTVAFAGNQGAYGNLVVINHAQGMQTRYAQLSSIRVKVGQSVKQGQAIATVGTTGRPSSAAPHLHFEVRSTSELGWVAEDPAAYIQAIRVAEPTVTGNRVVPKPR